MSRSPRQIRMSSEEARRAGLLDPDVADLVAPEPSPRRPRKTRKTKAKTPSVPSEQSAAAPAPKKKRRRSVSRPAHHPEARMSAGEGSVSLAADGRVAAAEFRFDLVPVPKERPRVVTNPKTNQVFGYTPARTRHFSTKVSDLVGDVFEGRPPIEGPVLLEMTFVMQTPRSWPKWKKIPAVLEGLIAPTGRPDMDNLEKALLDAFNGTLIVDDAYVVERRARKVYGPLPEIRVRVTQTGQFGIGATRAEVEAARAVRRRLEDEKLGLDT